MDINTLKTNLSNDVLTVDCYIANTPQFIINRVLENESYEKALEVIVKEGVVNVTAMLDGFIHKLSGQVSKEEKTVVVLLLVALANSEKREEVLDMYGRYVQLRYKDVPWYSEVCDILMNSYQIENMQQHAVEAVEKAAKAFEATASGSTESTIIQRPS